MRRGNVLSFTRLACAVLSTAHAAATHPRLDFDPHEPLFMTGLCQMALDAGALIMQHYKNGVQEEKGR